MQPLPILTVMLNKVLKQKLIKMAYINAILVLTIVLIVAKLSIEYREMGNSQTRVKRSQAN